MRNWLLGLSFASLAAVFLTSSVMAKDEGVESVGFEGYYRPDCWTPMVVSLKPPGSANQVYQIQVEQEDLDQDRVVFTRTISLQGATAGGGKRKFWMYFLPRPSQGGLPSTADELRDILRVYLCNEDGERIKRLPILTSIRNVDPVTTVVGERRAHRVVLVVRDAGKPPSLAWLNEQKAPGAMEQTIIVNATSDQLPDNELGYSMLDTIVWATADPANLDREVGAARIALERWVRQGGRLIILQPGEQWQQVRAFGDMLPVDVYAVEARSIPKPLLDMSRANRLPGSLFQRVQGPLLVGKARLARGGATPSDRWMTWPAPEGVESPPEITPFIASKSYGVGTVTWVATDLSDTASTMADVRALPNQTAARGWAYVWAELMGGKDMVMPLPSKSVNPSLHRDIINAWRVSYSRDLGGSMVQGIEHSARGGWLISLAVFFFFAYLILAGPITYVILRAQKKTHLSWPLFSAAALAATLLTMAVVQLVLRGEPSVKHVTLVQSWRGSDGKHQAIAHSRIGIYSPQDGKHDISIHNAVPDSMSHVAPLSLNPQFAGADIRFAAPDTYSVSLAPSDGTHRISPLIRSTLKKVQTRWRGELPAGIDGQAHIDERGWLRGTLVNGAGRDLRDVYIAVRKRDDHIYYIPKWDKGTTFRLDTLDDDRSTKKLNPGKGLVPGRTESNLRGRIFRLSAQDNPADNLKSRRFSPNRREPFWDDYWMKSRGLLPTLQQANETFDDSSDGYRLSFPMLSFYSLLRPDYVPQPSSGNDVRYELFRRGARQFDLGQAVSAGDMVVIARAEGDLPYEMRIEGTRPASERTEGVTFYQFVIDVDRSKSVYDQPPKPATQPAKPPEGDDSQPDMIVSTHQPGAAP